PSRRRISATRTRSHGSSCAPRYSRYARSSSSRSGKSASRSKAPSPLLRVARLRRIADHPLVNHRALARAGAEQAPHPLHVLALAQTPAHHDPDLGSGPVESPLQRLGGHQRPDLAGAEASEDVVALAPADVAGERRDQLLAGDGVSGLVVGREHTRLVRAMPPEQQRQRLALAARKSQQASGAPPGGD